MKQITCLHVLFDVVVPSHWMTSILQNNRLGGRERQGKIFSLKIIPLHFHSTLTNSSGIKFSIFISIYKSRRHEREGLTNTLLSILLVKQNRFLIFIETATVTNNGISNNKKNYVHVRGKEGTGSRSWV